MQDASDVMQLLLKTQTDFNDLEDDDPQVYEREYLALVQISKTTYIWKIIPKWSYDNVLCHILVNARFCNTCIVEIYILPSDSTVLIDIPQ